MLTPNPRIVFVKRPIGQYKAGEHTIFDSSKSIDIENVPLNGGFLTRLIFLSPEPYLRHRMREPKESGYSSTWKLQAPPTSFGLIEVIRSEDPTIKVGTRMYANTREYRQLGSIKLVLTFYSVYCLFSMGTLYSSTIR